MNLEAFFIAVALLYGVASIATFAAYAGDKSASRQGRWRTKERTLHVLALAGGWPGALLAQHFLRHKSAKARFRTVFRVTVFLNIGGVALAYSAAVRLFLHA